MSEKISVAIVDDHPMILEGLKRALRLAAHLNIVAEGSTAEAACRIAQDIKPDIMLLDIGIPGHGINAAQKISTSYPEVKVIVLTGSDDDEHAAAALAAGVKGYLLKGTSVPEMISAINAVQNGTPYVNTLLASRLLVRKFQEETSAYHMSWNRLSSREMEIFTCAAEGLKNNEIAAKLGLRERSVKNCMSRILMKLGARNRVDAIMTFGFLRGARPATISNTDLRALGCSTNGKIRP